MKPLLNSQEVMNYLSISRRKFQELVSSDTTFPARKIGGVWKTDIDELKEWFRNQPGAGQQVNVVQMPTRKRGRPPKQTVTPKGGWEIKIPN